MTTKRRIEWKDVTGVLGSDPSRALVVASAADAGVTRDDFESSRRAREVYCTALTRLEDALESKTTPRVEGERRGVREVRRRLEQELWP